MAVSDSSPPAFAGMGITPAKAGNPEVSSLGALCGIFFPLNRCEFSWGRASTPACVAPEAMDEWIHSCKAYER
jgi:hypothetical protein